MDEEVQGQDSPQYDLDKLTAIYLKMRDKRDDMRRDAEAREKEIEEQMSIIEAEMLEVCKQMIKNSKEDNEME